KTAGQLQDLAKKLSVRGIIQHAIADSLARVVGSGTFKGKELEIVAKASAKMKQSVGKDVDETIKEFEKLKKDPLGALEALDDKMHFLTAAQYEYINSLIMRGEKEKAATEAIFYGNAFRCGRQNGCRKSGAMEKPQMYWSQFVYYDILTAVLDKLLCYYARRILYKKAQKS
ncbi:MAG: phage tail length tape measure family protein, partial [Candidatus Phlomobacter fragariae]